MSLESADFIPGLVATNPEGTDPKSQGDDHLRLLKHVLKTQFPAFVGAPVTKTEAQLNEGLIAGAFGLGGPVIQIADLNAVPNQTGFYGTGASPLNAPPGAVQGDTFLHMFFNANSTTQYYQRYQDSQPFVRSFNTGVWNAWKPLPFGPRQAGVTDPTIGALMATGAFGLGAVSIPHILDLDALTITGIYRAYAGTAGVPGAANLGITVLHVAVDGAGTMVQLGISMGYAVVYSRSKSGGTWSSWRVVTGIGVDQTWQNMTGTRAGSVTYTNSTEKPIQVNVTVRNTGSSGGVSVGLQIGGVLVGTSSIPLNVSTTSYAFVTGIVPPGATYLAGITNGLLDTWAELR